MGSGYRGLCALVSDPRPYRETGLSLRAISKRRAGKRPLTGWSSSVEMSTGRWRRRQNKCSLASDGQGRGCRKLSDWRVGMRVGSEDWGTRLEGHSDQDPVRNLGKWLHKEEKNQLLSLVVLRIG